MVAIDRELQTKILRELQEAYPSRLDTRSLKLGRDLKELGANIAYLEEHGLVDANWAHGAPVANAKITARGLDFLADDGGLSAILGVLTVRLHEETQLYWQRRLITVQNRSRSNQRLRNRFGRYRLRA